MLVLSRNKDEVIMIGDDIEVCIVDIRGDKVRIGINAPREVSVHRKEIWDKIQEEKASWFGKGCKDQCCQWEENEETGGPDYKEAHPALIFCNHPENASDCEGNCSESQCPRG